jgi:Ca2+-binding EF-hand superfamily protein
MIELRKELKGELKDIQPHIREKLFLILDYEDKGAVSELEYFGVMKPWASFSATDINNDNELDAGELKTLIWLVEEVEPSEARVQRDLKLIDEDKSGTIDRLEYISFLASPADSSGEGREHFDFELKKKFDGHDKDKDGL